MGFVPKSGFVPPAGATEAAAFQRGTRGQGRRAAPGLGFQRIDRRVDPRLDLGARQAGRYRVADAHRDGPRPLDEIAARPDPAAEQDQKEPGDRVMTVAARWTYVCRVVDVVPAPAADPPHVQSATHLEERGIARGGLPDRPCAAHHLRLAVGRLDASLTGNPLRRAWTFWSELDTARRHAEAQSTETVLAALAGNPRTRPCPCPNSARSTARPSPAWPANPARIPTVALDSGEAEDSSSSSPPR